jgi:hypothetical protein
MPVAWVAFLFGAVLVYSAWKDQNVLDTLLGRGGHIEGGSPGDIPDLQHGQPGTPSLSDTPTPTLDSSKGKAGVLVSLGHIAESYGLRVSECNAPGAPKSWGPVTQVHVPGSMHYMGRAFDTSGSETQMHAYCQFIHQHYKATLTQLIHNPGFAVYHGHDVGPAVYAAVWAGHRNHVHVGV